MHSINAVGDPEMQIYTDTPHFFNNSELPYIYYDNNYVFITAHTDCVISGVSFDLNYSFSQTMQAGNSATYSLPGGGYICMTKKNHVPYFYYASQIPDEDDMESGYLRCVAGGNNMINVYIESSDNNDTKNKIWDWKLEIFNALTGQTVYSENVNTFSHDVDTSGWSKGIYVLKTNIDNQNLVTKTSIK